MAISDHAERLLRPYLTADDDGAWLPGAIKYLDRNSLWIRRIDDPDASDPTLLVANDATGYRLRLSDLRARYLALLQGEAFDWSTMEEADP